MKTTTQQTYWAIQATSEEGEKHLAFSEKGHLFFAENKNGNRKVPSPVLFHTKKQALEAVKEDRKKKVPKKLMVEMFETIVQYHKPKAIRVTLQWTEIEK